MVSSIDQAFQALYLSRTLGLNFHEALTLVTQVDRAVCRTMMLRGPR